MYSSMTSYPRSLERLLVVSRRRGDLIAEAAQFSLLVGYGRLEIIRAGLEFRPDPTAAAGSSCA